MTRLRGGPFLEISLMISRDDIRQIFTELSNLSNLSITEDNLDDLIHHFETGYLYDEQDMTSQRIHSISLNITVDIQGIRKSLLFINQVAEQTVVLDFCFFGSELDALEWEQPGIKADEYHFFIDYLSELLIHFQGCLGAVAIENDVLGLISENHSWPDNVFNCESVNPVEFLERGIQRNYIGVGIRTGGITNIKRSNSKYEK